MSFNFYVLSFLNFVFTLSLQAKPIKAVASVPDLAYIIQEIGGPLVSAKSLLSGRENPHYVDAIPDYVQQVANADVVCMVGLELEVGYMPAILARSGNAKVQVGSSSYCDASKRVVVVEKASGPLDRSMGDVHPHGNPHYYLSPTAMISAAEEIHEVLSRVSPQDKNQFTFGFEKLRSKLLTLLKNQQDKLKGVDRSRPLVIEYHKEFSYVLNEYKLKSFGSIEEKPGVPPSSGRIAQIALAAKKAGVKVILATDYNPQNVLKKFSELSQIPILQVPTMIQPGSAFDTYDKVQIHLVDSLLKALTTPDKTSK